MAIHRAIGTLVAAAVLTGSGVSASRQSEARTVVIAELFTSEGCSSCPPADDLLRRLIDTQPVKGVEVIGLSNHVDYWDALGWRDPFSSSLFSARQSRYDDAVFKSDRIYTPQLVVDGVFEAVGSDDNAVRRAILRAAARPKAIVTVGAIPGRDGRARVDVRVDVPANARSHQAAEIVVAVTEDGLNSRVKRGENGGRTLSHSAVVRSLTVVGQIDAEAETAAATADVAIDSTWKTVNIRVVAFAQEKDSRRILGGGYSLLARAPDQDDGHGHQ